MNYTNVSAEILRRDNSPIANYFGIIFRTGISTRFVNHWLTTTLLATIGSGNNWNQYWAGRWVRNSEDARGGRMKLLKFKSL